MCDFSMKLAAKCENVAVRCQNVASGLSTENNAPATFQAVMNRLFSQNKHNADGTENPITP